MNELKKSNAKPKWPEKLANNEKRDIFPKKAPDSHVVARKLDDDLKSAESAGQEADLDQDDSAKRLTDSSNSAGAESPNAQAFRARLDQWILNVGARS